MHFLRKKVRNNLQMSKKSRIFVVAFGKLRQMLLFDNKAHSHFRSSRSRIRSSAYALRYQDSRKA